MIKSLQLMFRRFASGMRYPKGCGYEEIIKRANSIKEPNRLDHIEECKMCIPGPEKDVVAPEKLPDVTPINGVPCYAYERNTAFVKKPAKNVMQQGTANTKYYIMSFAIDVPWENPTMGWASGSNSLKDVEIRFPNKESALNFVERNGWNVLVSKEPTKKKIKQNYGLNFHWNKRTRVSTK